MEGWTEARIGFCGGSRGIATGTTVWTGCKTAAVVESCEVVRSTAAESESEAVVVDVRVAAGERGEVGPGGEPEVMTALWETDDCVR